MTESAESESFYSWILQGQYGGLLEARDLFENGKKIPANHTNNHFFPDLILERAEQIIKDSDPSKPFYIHFATTLPRKSDERNRGAQFSMPQFQLRPAVRSLLNDTWIERKKHLGRYSVSRTSMVFPIWHDTVFPLPLIVSLYWAHINTVN